MTEQRYTPALGREVTLRDNGSDNEVWHATFDGLYHVPPAMPAPATVLDLGANIGLTAAHYRVLWPDARIVAVEMDYDCAVASRQNAPGVEVCHYAVSAQGGPGFYDAGRWPSNFAFIPGYISSPNVAVASFTLADLIGRHFGTSVDFVKMDVEGEEWSIFQHGDWAPFVNHLLVELHGGDPDEMVANAIAALTSLDFDASRHDRHPHAVWAHR